MKQVHEQAQNYLQYYELFASKHRDDKCDLLDCFNFIKIN